jgi:phage terminase large subunit
VRLVDHIGVRMRVLCIRRFQHRIQDSVYTELKWAIAHLGLEAAYDVQKTTIIHRRTGAEFIVYGIERNLGRPANCVGDAEARSILQKYSC